MELELVRSVPKNSFSPGRNNDIRHRRPQWKVGDFCRYDQAPSPDWLRVGAIEEIGLRSTRIRRIDCTVTTFPSAWFFSMETINLIKRDRTVFDPPPAQRYETNGDLLRLVLAKLREMLLAHPWVTEDPARARFPGFADYG